MCLCVCMCQQMKRRETAVLGLLRRLVARARLELLGALGHHGERLAHERQLVHRDVRALASALRWHSVRPRVLLRTIVRPLRPSGRRQLLHTLLGQSHAQVRRIWQEQRLCGGHVLIIIIINLHHHHYHHHNQSYHSNRNDNCRTHNTTHSGDHHHHHYR